MSNSSIRTIGEWHAFARDHGLKVPMAHRFATEAAHAMDRCHTPDEARDALFRWLDNEAKELSTVLSLLGRGFGSEIPRTADGERRPEDSHRLHVHFNYNESHDSPPEQICLATYPLKPGSQVSMHMHRGHCVRCPSGHCHQPNITLVMTEGGELMLTFENFNPPLYIEGNDAGEAPRVITHQTPKLITGGEEVDYADA